MKQIYFLIIILSSLATKLTFAEYPYEVLEKQYTVQDSKSTFEVSNVSPTKSQDGVGLCYGFTATTLIENFRCQELKLNCLDQSEQLSSLDVSSYYLSSTQKSIQEAGNTHTLLSNFNRSKRKVVKEECAKFSTLVHKSHQQFNPSEGQGWKFLTSLWNNFKEKSKKQQLEYVSCYTSNVKNKMKSLNTPENQLRSAFLTADSLESFLYKAIVPEQCLLDEKNSVQIPNFALNGYPAPGEKASKVDIMNKIEKVLLNNIPLEMSICTDENAKTNCEDGKGHSITLFGIKEACHPTTNDCRMMVRVKNSYGWGWQRDNNDGWVDLETITKASMAQTTFNNINWISKPGSKLENKTLPKKQSTISTYTNETKPEQKKYTKVPDKYKNYVGIWKCPGSTYLDHFETGCVPFMDMK